MGFLSNLFRGRIIDKVEELIVKWDPPDCKTEEEYENALHEYLQTNLRNVPIRRKHAVGETEVDLLIYNNVLVEVKKDLASKSRLTNLIDELESYLSEAEYVILILCGHVDTGFLNQLREKYGGKLSKGPNEDHCRLTIIKE